MYYWSGCQLGSRDYNLLLSWHPWMSLPIIGVWSPEKTSGHEFILRGHPQVTVKRACKSLEYNLPNKWEISALQKPHSSPRREMEKVNLGSSHSIGREQYLWCDQTGATCHSTGNIWDYARLLDKDSLTFINPWSLTLPSCYRMATLKSSSLTAWKGWMSSKAHNMTWRMSQSPSEMWISTQMAVSFTQEGTRYAGMAVITGHKEVIWAQTLPRGTSTQRSEIISLMQALWWAKEKKVNIYTDSQYALLQFMFINTL